MKQSKYKRIDVVGKRLLDMRYEYIRIDTMMLIESRNHVFQWLHEQPDAEYREDYCCFFIPSGSRTHTWLALNHPDLFTNNPY